MKKIVILQGHPDDGAKHLCHALADAYRAGAEAAGHQVSVIDVAALDFPLLRSKEEWENMPAPDVLLPAQAALLEADHIAIFFPLWLGSLPARLKGFFEQVFRPAMAGGKTDLQSWGKLMRGCSVRIFVTMGMPAIAFRLFFLSHGIRFFERNVLRFTGCGPIRRSLVGNVEGLGERGCRAWLDKARSLGEKGL